MIFRPRSTRRSAVAALLLASIAIVGPVLAAPGAPSNTDVGPDGHWIPVANWPFGYSGRVVHDALHDRVFLVRAGEVWELPLTEPLAWTRISTPTDSVAGASLVVYDPGADRLLGVIPGSSGDSMHVRELPLSNPAAWLELSSVGAPQGSWSPGGAVFDPASNAIHIIGGNTYNPPADFLEVAWSTFATVNGSSVSFSPKTNASNFGARAYFSTAVDAERSRWIVYGGMFWDYSRQDVRTAPLGSMTFDAPAVMGTPPPSQGQAAVDPVRDRMLFHAFEGAPRMYQLTFTPFMQWSEVVTTGSPPSLHLALAYDAGEDRMVGFKFGQLWTLSPGVLFAPETWANRTPPAPDGPSGSVIVGDPNSSRLVHHASGNDLWAVSTVEPFPWSRLVPTGTPPPSRIDHEGVYDSARDRMILFGGRANASTPPMNDVWTLSLGGSPAWSAITPAGTPPAARHWPSAVYDPVGDRMLVWGGADGATQYSDLWQLTLSGTPGWSPLSPLGAAPGHIENANAIHDPVRARMLIIGGALSGECWALTLGGTPEWTPLPTCPGSSVNAFHDAALDRLVAINHSGELYALSLADPDAWHPLAPTGTKPASASAPALVADAARNRAFVLPTNGSSTMYQLAFIDALGSPAGTPQRRVTLSAVAPNPAWAGATVRLSLPAEADVTLEVFDAAGRRVRRLALGRMTAGEHPVSWDLRDASGRRVGPGVFVYALTVGGERVTRRGLVLR
jgi:hypothetical protein